LSTAMGKAAEAFWIEGRSLFECYRACRDFLWSFVACVAVTFVNPYTWHLHSHIFTYLTNAKLLDNIQEFQSTSFHSPADIFQEIRPFEKVRRVHLASAAGLLLLAVLFASGQKGFEAQFNPESFPSQMVSIVRSSGARHILTYDQWGDYLIYQLYPSKQV